jgi:hypothetical protein
LDAYGVEADISQLTISAETVENDPQQTFSLDRIVSFKHDLRAGTA